MSDEKPIIKVHTAIDVKVTDFSSAAWQEAEPVMIDHYWSGELAPPGRQAEARLLWSDEAMHTRFVCHQAETLVINPTPQTKKRTLGLWDRDVCEIFIAPDPDFIERYMEFEAAPTGEWLDVAIHWSPEKKEPDWDFNSRMTTAAKIERDRVAIAMRIPWSDRIPKPQKGDRWRANLFRCVGSAPDRGYLAWRPTRTPKPNFHVPQAFGSLVFD